jgi:spore germination cell wall hydrolase CwlJ-like protein
MKKKSIAALFTAIFLSTAGAHASQAATTSISVDGKTVQTNSLIQNNSTMVPAVFFQNAGVKVGWNEQYHAVTLQKGDMIIGLPSGKNYADVYTKASGVWKRDYVNTTTTDRKDGTYIPLRYAAEKLGFQITNDNPAALSISTQTSTAKPSTQAQSIENSKYTKEDIYWLCQLTEAEAGGEPYVGKVAVAASVLNRVESPDWPNTVKGVIFQVTRVNGVDYYQYSPVLDGRIYNVKPSQDTIAAVQEAINGKDPSQAAIIFYNPTRTDNKWIRSRPVTVTIGNHVFAK